MRETPGALDKLYSMLHEADTLGLSRPARLRLIGIIGSLESEELERFRDQYVPAGSVDAPSLDDDDRRFHHSRH